MTSCWLRPATAQDAAAVRDLSRRARRELRAARRDASEVDFGPHGHSWVVEAGRGEIVGCCRVGEGDGGRWEISELYLAAEWRGAGLGRALAEQALRTARSHGALAVVMRVPADAAEGVGLARRLGFADGGDEPDGVVLMVRTFVGAS